MKPIGVMLALAAATLVAVPAVAQDYPTKAVRIVVTFTPGGSSDVTARALAIPLQKQLGQPVVVDNKPGAGGTIAASEIARAAPDGYNLLMSNTTPISLAPFMPLPSTPPLMTSAGTPDVFQSVVTNTPARWPPDDWPLT